MKSTLLFPFCLAAALAASPADCIQLATPPDSSPLAEQPSKNGAGSPRQLDAEPPLAPVATDRAKTAATELVGQLFAPANEPRPTGSPTQRRLTLADVLPVETDPQHQIAVTHAYWDLAARRASWRIRYDALSRLETLVSKHSAEAAAASPRVAALLAGQRARLEETQLELLKARRGLGEVANPAAVDMPVVTLDVPHAGAYRTYFKEIYAKRTPSPAIRLIDLTLPLHEQVIVSLAAAAHAEDDVYEAVLDQYAEGRSTIESVLEAAEARGTRALLELVASVRAYNRDIASYAFVSVPPGLDRATLVGMLVKSGPIAAGNAESRPPEVASASPEVERAGFDQTLPAERPAPPAVDGQTAETGLFSAVSAASAEAQTTAIASLLHGDRGLPSDVGQAVSLVECLRGVAPERRLLVLEAYWSARAAAACYQAVSRNVEHLARLAPAVLEARSAPDGPEAMLKLRAARLAADARLAESHRELLAACGRLGEVSGRPGSGEFLLPSTPPAAAPLPLKQASANLEAAVPQSDAGAQLVSQSFHVVAGFAGAVVAADEARVAAAAKFHSGQSGVEDVLRSIDLETTETLAFLSALAAYNRDLAWEVMQKLPRESSVEAFVGVLGVNGMDSTR